MLREMLMDPLLGKYCAIMVDEVHERSLNTDILLSLLKKIAKVKMILYFFMNYLLIFYFQKRPELRIIISSATLDAEELRDYFDLNKKKKSSNENKQQEEYQSGSSVIMSVSGRCYPVDIFYVQGNSFKSNIFIIKNNKLILF